MPDHSPQNLCKNEYIYEKKSLKSRLFREVPPGFEPGIEVLQTFALPLGYGTRYNIVCISLKENDSKGI
jgi:hypothetical protein